MAVTPPPRPRGSPTALGVTQHTAIVEYVLEHRAEILAAGLPPTIDDLLTQLSSKPSAAAIAQHLNDAASAVRDLDRDFQKFNPADPNWPTALAVMRRILDHKGDVPSLVKLLQAEQQGASGALLAGLQVAIDILAAGAKTIYSDDHWMAMVMDPRGLTGQAGNLRNLGSHVGGLGERAVKTAKDDVVGAVAGAAGSLASGGGLAGAGRAAVSSGVSSSVKSVLSP